MLVTLLIVAAYTKMLTLQHTNCHIKILAKGVNIFSEKL